MSFRGVDGLGLECGGGYTYRVASAPTTPTVGGPFGGLGAYGQTAEIVVGVIGAAATTAATIYQLDLQRRLAKQAEHQREREAAAAAAAAAQQAAQQDAAAAQQAAMLEASAGQTPTGQGVLERMKSIPVWGWAALGGGALVLTLAMTRGRR